jgi:hypothetical protein
MNPFQLSQIFLQILQSQLNNYHLPQENVTAIFSDPWLQGALIEFMPNQILFFSFCLFFTICCKWKTERQLKHQYRVYCSDRSPVEEDLSKRARAHGQTQAWARCRGLIEKCQKCH